MPRFHSLLVVLGCTLCATCLTTVGDEKDLLRNGSFEAALDQGWTGRSTVPCWRHKTGVGRKESAGVVVDVPAGVDAVQGISFVNQPVAVKEGDEVFFHLWYRADKSLQGGTLRQWLNFRPEREKGERLGRDIRYNTNTSLIRDSQWHELVFRTTVPEGKRFVTAGFGFWWLRGGKIAFDDAALYTRTASHLPSALHKLDCGPADSDVFASFTLLSDKDAFAKGRNPGWDGQVQAFARYYSQNPFRRPDPLAADFCYAKNARLKLELPPGKYGVVVLTGDIGSGWGYNVLGTRTGMTISVAGKALAERPPLRPPEIRDKRILATYRKPDWQPGDYVWDKYVAPSFTQHKILVGHPGGGLVLDFKTCPVNMVAVYGPDKLGVMDAELADLDKARREMFPFTRRDETPVPKAKLAPSEAEKKRGYLVFSRRSSRPVFPTEIPAAGERREIKLFASRGEHESGSLVVHALRDLKGATIRVGELRSETGTVFPQAQIGAHYVRYMDVLVGVTYSCKPRIVQKLASPLDVPAGSNRQFWLVFDVTRNIQPGTYKGHVTVECANAEPAKIPILVRVLPIDLPRRVPDCWYMVSTWNMYEASYLDTPETRWALYRGYVTCLKDHGMDTLFLGTGPWERPTATWDGKTLTDVDTMWFERALNLYRELGFTEDCVFVSRWPYAYLVRDLAKGDEAATAEITKQYLNALERVRKEKFARIAAYHMGAVSDGWPFEKGMERMKPYLDSDVSTYMQNIHLHDTLTWFPYVGLMLYSPHAPNGVRAVANLARNLGKPFGFSNVGFRVRDKTCKSWWRFLWGWWFWRTGAQVQANEHYVFLYTDPYNPFDGRASERASMGFPTPTGISPTISMTWMRDGRDDHRYIALLEQLIEKGLVSGKPDAVRLAKESRDFLHRMEEQIPLEAKAFNFDEDIPGWSTGSFPRACWYVANKIIKLQEALEGR